MHLNAWAPQTGSSSHIGTDTDPPAGNDDGQMLSEAEVQVLPDHMIDHLGRHPAQVHLQQSVGSGLYVWGCTVRVVGAAVNRS